MVFFQKDKQINIIKNRINFNSNMMKDWMI